MIFLANQIPSLTTHISITIVIGLFIVAALTVVISSVVCEALELSDKAGTVVAFCIFILTTCIVIGISALLYHASWIDYTRSLKH